MKNVLFKPEDDICSLQWNFLSLVSLVLGDYWAQSKQEGHRLQRENETMKNVALGFV